MTQPDSPSTWDHNAFQLSCSNLWLISISRIIGLVESEGRTIDKLKYHKNREMRRGDENLSRRQVDTEAHRYGDPKCQYSGEVQKSMR